MVQLVCPVCDKRYSKVAYEHQRNLRLGRTSVCGRSCQATHMDKSEAKLKNTREILAVRNANQYREDNPNWKGGISVSDHPLKPIPGASDADSPRRTDSSHVDSSGGCETGATIGSANAAPAVPEPTGSPG